MNKIFFLIFLLISCLVANPKCFKEGYGELIVSANEKEIILQNGVVLPYRTNDIKTSWDEKINNADLEMQVSQKYNTDNAMITPQYLFSPGRFRYQPFFDALYGKNEISIAKNLVTIKWKTTNGYKNLVVNSIADVDKRLILINNEISQLPFEERVIADEASTYIYRFIKDTNRLSMHSYGIAIDLSPNTTQYWKRETENETESLTYNNTMPLSIVRIFEKYGFIWGGRWYHYDTMHFEYRPELFAPSCITSENKSF